MAKTAMMFGFVLMVLGVGMFVATGNAHPTALIPAWFGVVIALCGALARTEDAKKRMLFMHVAVTVGLIGFLFPGIMAVRAMMKSHAGLAVDRPAVHEQMAMTVICFVFVLLCVRSFIAARRARAAA